jgi:multisubunit Na+/H+ antiporter MnhF subunit
MNPWLIAAIALLPPFAVGAIMTALGPASQRLVAAEFASILAAPILMLLAMAVDQPSFLDVALTLVIVGLPGTILYAHFLERWL